MSSGRGVRKAGARRVPLPKTPKVGPRRFGYTEITEAYRALAELCTKVVTSGVGLQVLLWELIR